MPFEFLTLKAYRDEQQANNLCREGKLKYRVFLFALMFASIVRAQEFTPTPFANIPTGQWKLAEVPWDDWFKKNVIATDKGDHVHYMWNAQDAKTNFDGKDQKFRLADSALELAAKLQPSTATSDRSIVDIVYVLERDSYGMPKWDSLQRVAHFEFSRAKALKILKTKKAWTEASLKKAFTAVEFF